MDRQRWRWKAESFEILELPNVSTKRDSEEWIVHLKTSEAFAWGYCIPVPESSRNHILWRATLHVKQAAGGGLPGIAFRDGERGILFQANGTEAATSLRFMLANDKTVGVETFDMKKLLYPCEMVLEYNALTGSCGGFIGQTRAFDVTLPHRGIPAFPAITAMEIVTTALQNEAKNEVRYKDLLLHSE